MTSSQVEDGLAVGPRDVVDVGGRVELSQAPGLVPLGVRLGPSGHWEWGLVGEVSLV